MNVSGFSSITFWSPHSTLAQPAPNRGGEPAPPLLPPPADPQPRSPSCDESRYARDPDCPTRRSASCNPLWQAGSPEPRGLKPQPAPPAHLPGSSAGSSATRRPTISGSAGPATTTSAAAGISSIFLVTCTTTTSRSASPLTPGGAT